MDENIYLECISGEAWSLDFRSGTQQAEFEQNQVDDKYKQVAKVKAVEFTRI